MKKILFVITSHDTLGDTGEKTGLWLEEFTTPYYKMKDKGFELVVASPKGGKVPVDPKSLLESSLTETTKRYDADSEKVLDHTIKLEDVKDLDSFDGIFYPGGHGPMFDLAYSDKNAEILAHFYEAKKPIAALCHGPAALTKAVSSNGESILKGKKVTGFSNSEEIAVKLEKAVPFSLEDKLKELGVTYEKESDFKGFAVRDENIVTGQNPASAEPTADLFLEILKK